MTSIKNVSEQDMNDVIWEMSIPTGLEVMKSIGHNDFISTKDNSNDGETKSGATKILLGDLKAGETKYVTIELGVQEPAEEINIVSKVSAKNVPEHYSNEFIFYGKKIKLQIEQNVKQGQKQTVKEGENIEYIVTVENIGELVSTENVVEIKIPTETRLVEAKYIYNGTEYVEDSTYDNILSIDINSLQPNEKIDINVKLVAKQLGEQQEKEVIIEPATLTATAIDKIQATNKFIFNLH